MQNTPTPGFASTASNLTSIHRSMSARHQQVPSPNMTSVNISVDGSEAHRRSLESDVQRRLAGNTRPMSEKHPSPAFKSFDQDSPRFGDNPRARMNAIHQAKAGPAYTRRARVQSGSSSETEESDTASLHIALKHQPSHKRPSPFRPSTHRAPASEDSSSVHTASPQKQQPSYMMSQDSPVSGFDGMARELRREFERITAGNGRAYQSGLSRDSAVKQSPSRTSAAARPVLGEIGNTMLTSQRPYEPAKTTNNKASFSPASSYTPRNQYADVPFPSSPPQSAFHSRISEPSPPQQHKPYSRSASPHRPASTRYDNEAAYQIPDITGVTDCLASPEKGLKHRRVAVSSSQARTAASEQAQIPAPQLTRKAPMHSRSQSDTQLSTALGQLEARLHALEDENGNSAERVKELEGELERNHMRGQRDHGSDSGFGTGSNRSHVQDRGAKAAHQQEELVDHLQAHVTRLTKSLATHANSVNHLKANANHGDAFSNLRLDMQGCSQQMEDLVRSVDRLSREIEEVRAIIESLVEQKTSVQQDHLRHTHTRPTFGNKLSDPLPGSRARSNFNHVARDQEQRPQSAPLPETTQGFGRYLNRELANDPDLQRAEAILRSVPTEHDESKCQICQHRYKQHSPPSKRTSPKVPNWRDEDDDEGFGGEMDESSDSIPPQTVLSRALRDLEEDFASHKRIYNELCEAYKKMDPASKVTKRRTLAAHLKESIDVLESKADQIKRLYDLLHYQSHPDALPYLNAARHR